eukprot:TRINITY_DN17363_c0_g1_i1.p1 TRINITY_DN17363_c0_g1~~TRINITY_DN17363_c0_g1_i1.p1  ORF type:complete len:333 (+),score=77.55 TRINITY_DN17363_c0_g1_i1:48-1046(+)
MAVDLTEPDRKHVHRLDDGPVNFDDIDLAVQAVHHPQIEQTWRACKQSGRLTNNLFQRVKGWLADKNGIPSECVEQHNVVLGDLQILQKELELLDSLDLDELKPEWGDKVTVRAARKTLIAFAEVVMSRLDVLQSSLAESVRAERAKREKERAVGPAEPQESLQEKYRDVLNAAAVATAAPGAGTDEPVAKRRRVAGTAQVVLAAILGAEIERAPPAGAAAADLNVRLKRLRDRLASVAVAVPNTRSLKSLGKQLVKLAAMPELGENGAGSGELCFEALETVSVAMTMAAEQKPAKKALANLLALAKRLEVVQEPKAFQDLLADLSFALKGL